MKNDREVLHKPNQTIMITNKDISALQRKAYNVILHKAWNDLKTNDRQTEFKFSITDLKSKAGLKATDNVKLKKGLEDLTTIGVKIVKDNGDWTAFSLLSYAKKEGDDLVIELPKPVRQALIDNSFYTTLDLFTLKSLEGKYAIILYEMAIRYQKKQIPEMSIDELKQLTGTAEKKSYINFKNFNTYVLAPAIKEINEKTDIILSFREITRGRKIVSIKFIIESKSTKTQSNQPTINKANNVIGLVKKQPRLLHPNMTNFKQREYSDEELESLFSNKD